MRGVGLDDREPVEHADRDQHLPRRPLLPLGGEHRGRGVVGQQRAQRGVGQHQLVRAGRLAVDVGEREGRQPLAGRRGAGAQLGHQPEDRLGQRHRVQPGVGVVHRTVDGVAQGPVVEQPVRLRERGAQPEQQRVHGVGIDDVQAGQREVAHPGVGAQREEHARGPGHRATVGERDGQGAQLVAQPRHGVDGRFERRVHRPPPVGRSPHAEEPVRQLGGAHPVHVQLGEQAPPRAGRESDYRRRRRDGPARAGRAGRRRAGRAARGRAGRGRSRCAGPRRRRPHRAARPRRAGRRAAAPAGGRRARSAGTRPRARARAGRRVRRPPPGRDRHRRRPAGRRRWRRPRGRGGGPGRAGRPRSAGRAGRGARRWWWERAGRRHRAGPDDRRDPAGGPSRTTARAAHDARWRCPRRPPRFRGSAASAGRCRSGRRSRRPYCRSSGAPAASWFRSAGRRP